MKFALIKSPASVFLGVCIIAEGLGFMKFFNHWVYFPFFPNVLDSLVLIGAGAFFMIQSQRKQVQAKQKQESDYVSYL